MVRSMLESRFGVLRSLRGDGNRAVRSVILASTVDQIADWAVLIALLALVYSISDDLRIVALFLLARLISRAVASFALGTLGVSWWRSWTWAAELSVIHAGAIACLIAVEQRADFWWAWPVVLVSSTAGVLLEARRCALLSDGVARLKVLAVNAACVIIGRAAFVGGALLSGGMLLWWSPHVVLLISAVSLILSAGFAVALALGRRSEGTDPAVLTPVALQDTSPDALPAVSARLRREPRVRLSIGSLFVNGLIAASMQLALVVIVFESFARPHAMLGFMFACVALGMLLGPLPIPKLLVRLSPGLLLVGVVGALALGLVAAIHTPLPAIVLAVAFVSGMLAITSEELAVLLVRRLVPGAQLDSALRAMQHGVTAGQLSALVGAVLVAELWVGDWTVIAITGACLCLIGILFLHDAGSRPASGSAPERMRRA